MRQRFLLISNALIVVFSTLLLALFQSTIWYHLFGHVPSPMLWFLPLIYFSIYRSASEGMILVYLTTISSSTMTAAPLPVLLVCSLGIFFLIHLVKGRIYWEGFRYYGLVATLSAMAFHFFEMSVALLVEDYFIDRFFLIERSISILMTSLFSFPVYRLLLWLDHMTEKDRLSVPGSYAI